MTDQVTIGNLALDAIGSRSEIASFTEESQSARTLSLHWDPARRTVLQAAHWNFARKQAALALLKDASATPPGTTPPPWIYEYAYPADCIQCRYVMPSFANTPGLAPGFQPGAAGPAVRFIVSSDVDAQGNPTKVILTNQPQAILVYTCDVTNTELFDDQFVEALYQYLGSRICLRVNGDKSMAKMAFDIADRVTREARSSNGNEGLTVIDGVPDWIRVRGYAADWAYPPGSIFWTSPQNLSFIS